MKALKLQAIITGIRSKVDRSLGLSISTPELSSEEKTEVMNLQGVNVNLLIEPLDEEAPELLQVNKEIEGKTPSQRMRAVIFILWKQLGEPGQFETYYLDKINRLIEALKNKIDA
jgi:hypothetical protein